MIWRLYEVNASLPRESLKSSYDPGYNSDAEAVVRIFSVNNLQNSMENTFIRVSFWPATLLKKRLWQRYFPVIFATVIRTTFYRTPLVAVSDYYGN